MNFDYRQPPHLPDARSAEEIDAAEMEAIRSFEAAEARIRRSETEPGRAEVS